MKRSLRIAVASSGLGHVARGIEAWAHDLATALASRDAAVTLYQGGGVPSRPYERVVPCLRRENSSTRRLLGVVPKAVGWRVGLGSGYAAEQTTFAVNLVRALRHEPADVLHVQDPLVALLAQRAWKLRLVRTRPILAHGTEEPLAFLRRIKFLQHLAPWHLDAARAAGAWRPTWTAIPNFIDTDRFSPGRADEVRAELGIPPAGLVVLSAAAIKRGHKRVDHLVAEFAQLVARRPDLPAWLVVAGGWEAETDALIAEATARLGDRVRFLVRYPRERMPALYRAADVFALASLFEMMPVSVLEATASGLPCLVHRHPVLEWMVGPGGQAVDMGSPGALAAALVCLLTHAPDRIHLGRQARAHCLAEFARDPVVDRIVEYYKVVTGPVGHRLTDRTEVSS